MARLALYRKWRPLDFDDVVGQEHITAALKSQAMNACLSHAYIFTGTRGTGKTSCAKILARAANCTDLQDGNPCNKCAACQAILEDSAMDVMEIDAASNNGVDNIREIRDEANYAPSALRRRTYIIDEVHMLSGGAFNALLKTLEEPPEHVLFILATTEIHKVPATILSRCQRYDFRRISPEIIANQLEFIAKEEGISLAEDAACLLARRGDGSMRDAISLLDRCVVSNVPIDASQVSASLGLAGSAQILGVFCAVCAHDGAQALQLFYDCYIQGRDIFSLLDELLSLIRDVYITKSVQNPEAMLAASAYTVEELSQVKDVAPELLEFYVQTISETLSRLTRSAIRRADAEVCILKISRAQSATAAPSVIIPLQAHNAAEKATNAQVPTQNPQGHAEAVAKPTKKQVDAPIRTQSTSGGGDSELKERFFAALKGKRMNPAVASYIRLANYSAKGSQLEVEVDDEGLLFLERDTVLEILCNAAKEIGMLGVKLRAKGHAEVNASDENTSGLNDILSNAAGLGVEIKE